MQQVAIIDFGMGNLRSVEKAVRYVGGDAVDVLVTADPERVAAADRVVFPGQGAIGDCMAELAAHGLEACVRDAIREKPFLGICIGLQALMEESEEDGGTRGLAAFRGRVTRFPPRDPVTRSRLKVPHMGWNQVRQATPHPSGAASRTESGSTSSTATTSSPRTPASSPAARTTRSASPPPSRPAMSLRSSSTRRKASAPASSSSATSSTGAPDRLVPNPAVPLRYGGGSPNSVNRSERK